MKNEQLLLPKRSSGKTFSRTRIIWKLLQTTLLCIGFTATLVAAKPLDEYLSMDLVQLMEVTVTSVAKKPQTLGETAAAVFVISQEDIRRSGVTSIPEALAMAPGLQVARISSSKWSISSRGFAGFTSNKLLVLIDGRSVYTPAYSGTFWDMQNAMLEDVERIEVVRGPGGTIWGANAVNGVINIITKKAQDTEGTLIRVGAGNQEKFLGAARVGASLGDSISGRIYVTGNDRDSNVLSEDGEDSFDGWHTLQTGFRVDGSLGKNDEWRLQGDLFKNDGDQLISPFWIDGPPYMAASYTSMESSGGNLLGQWQHTFTNGDLLSTQIYYDYTSRSEDFNISFHTLDGELQYETRIGDKNAITLGIGYRNIKGDNEDTFQTQLPNRTDELYSVFVQDAVTLIDDTLFLTLGTKWEHNEFTGSEWQPSGKLLYKPLENHSLWTSVARAVRTPSIMEDEGHLLLASFPTPSGTGTIDFVGSHDYHSESVVAYEAGYRWQPHAKLSFDFAAFYNDYKDIYTFTPQPSARGIDMIVINNGKGEGYGLELAADWRMTDWLHFYLSYSYLKSSFDWQDPSLAQDQLKSFVEQLSPHHQVGLRAAIDFTENWQANFWLRYVDSIEVRSSLELLEDEGTTIDSYYVFDANLTWKPNKNLEVTLVGQNLFNNSQPQYISEIHTPATEIERSIYAKITWSF